MEKKLDDALNKNNDNYEMDIRNLDLEQEIEKLRETLETIQKTNTLTQEQIKLNEQQIKEKEDLINTTTHKYNEQNKLIANLKAQLDSEKQTSKIDELMETHRAEIENMKQTHKYQREEQTRIIEEQKEIIKNHENNTHIKIQSKEK